jgi:hypothetical protein
MQLFGLKKKMLCSLDVFKQNSIVFSMHPVGFILCALIISMKEESCCGSFGQIKSSQRK